MTYDYKYIDDAAREEAIATLIEKFDLLGDIEMPDQNVIRTKLNPVHWILKSNMSILLNHLFVKQYANHMLRGTLTYYFQIFILLIHL